MPVLLLAVFLLAACGPSGKIAEPQRQDLDKAKAVQQSVDSYQQNLQQHIDASQ
ncbi:hypothetical protein [Vogesella oryzae]|uniref:hypothetical protein n=1 Tax=Vogesella oryzae TaxID=1735285 RepID=UPI0015831902|nr:hypothetical protein [Vogesella oryzae]